MKTDNNGKIIMGIAVMFVLAISIIGITYAYFTSQTRGNSSDASAKVVAGKLEVLYTQGNKIEATNIVPGWVSDGGYYYDPVYSAKLDEETGIYKIVAVTEDDTVTCTGEEEEKTISECSDAVDTPDKDDGISFPVEVNVQNTEKNAGDNRYVLKLHVDENDFATGDQKNLMITVKTPENNILWSGQLGTKGSDQYIVSSIEEIKKESSDKKTYKVYLTYVNADESQNDPVNPGYASGGKTVKATVSIEPVVNNGGSIYNADGEKVTLPQSSTTDYTHSPGNGLPAID